MGIGSETIIETGIEQGERNAKWNGMGIRVQGLEWGLGTENMKQNKYRML